MQVQQIQVQGPQLLKPNSYHFEVMQSQHETWVTGLDSLFLAFPSLLFHGAADVDELPIFAEHF